MKIGIVSQSNTNLRALSGVISASVDHSVAWVLSDKAAIAARCGQHAPDLLLLDVLILDKHDKQWLKELLELAACPIIVGAAKLDGNTSAIFEAMRWGALDVAVIPASQNDALGAHELLRKLSIISKLSARANTPRQPAQPVSQREATSATTPLVVIGASTGGPSALLEILRPIPATFRGTIVVVQHIDPEFVVGLAKWLDDSIPLKVVTAQAGVTPQPGAVYVACGPDDLILGKAGQFIYTPRQEASHYHPSIDIFFECCTARCATPTVAILLSGMGRDGVAGLQALRTAGWKTIAQNEASCVMYGMPKVAAESGAAAQILSLEEITAAIRASACTRTQNEGGAKR
jgi:two-component system response regulator WspF